MLFALFIVILIHAVLLFRINFSSVSSLYIALEMIKSNFILTYNISGIIWLDNKIRQLVQIKVGSHKIKWSKKQSWRSELVPRVVEGKPEIVGWSSKTGSNIRAQLCIGKRSAHWTLSRVGEQSVVRLKLMRVYFMCLFPTWQDCQPSPHTTCQQHYSIV